jgi:hypothetical protein
VEYTLGKPYIPKKCNKFISVIDTERFINANNDVMPRNGRGTSSFAIDFG